jgi:hypothetical protein
VVWTLSARTTHADGAPLMGTVFISYRRGDSSGHTGRLFDSLEDHFGREPFFRDIESLEYGIDFPAELDKALASCRVMLVMIGPDWLTAQDGEVRRLDQPGDFVRLEVAAALARRDVRTIPVLVGGAEMPSSEDLPQDLKPLSARNGLEISDTRWDHDVSRLADALARTAGLKDRNAKQATSTGPASDVVLAPNKRASLLGKAALIALGAVGAVVGLIALDELLDGEPPQIALGTFEYKGLTWTTDTTATDYDWKEADAHCTSLGDGWRLPTIDELRTIADPNNPDEAGTKILPQFHAEIGSNLIWSSDEDGDANRFVFDFEELKPESLPSNFKGDAQALCVWW